MVIPIKKLGVSVCPNNAAESNPAAAQVRVHTHMCISYACTEHVSFHAPVMMVARVLLYFFKIVSANLKKKLLNTP